MTVAPLRYVCTVNDETLPASTDSNYEFTYCDVTSVQTGHVNIPETTTMFSQAPSRARRIARPGDVVYATIRPNLKATALVPQVETPLIVSTAFAVLRPKEGLLPKYLAYAVQDGTFEHQLSRSAVGVSYPAIDEQTVKAARIPVPDMESQRRIVEFLDAETARIDNARATVQKLTELADELKIATVDQLCFGELRARVDQIDSYLPYNPHRNTYLAIRSACGELPSGWRYLRFKNIARRTRNRNEDGNLEMLSLRQTGEVVYRSSTAQNQEPSEESIPKYLAVSPGNLVLNPMWLRGGAVGVSELRGAVSPDYRVFELSEEIDASYLGFILRSRPFIEQYKLLERAETTFDRRIQQVDLDNLPIPAPPLEIQKQIVRQIDEQFAADNVMRPTLTRVAELLTERRSALITAAVTGELEV